MKVLKLFPIWNLKNWVLLWVVSLGYFNFLVHLSLIQGNLDPFFSLDNLEFWISTRMGNLDSRIVIRERSWMIIVMHEIGLKEICLACFVSQMCIINYFWILFLKESTNIEWLLPNKSASKMGTRTTIEIILTLPVLSTGMLMKIKDVGDSILILMTPSPTANYCRLGKISSFKHIKLFTHVKKQTSFLTRELFWTGT